MEYGRKMNRRAVRGAQYCWAERPAQTSAKRPPVERNDKHHSRYGLVCSHTVSVGCRPRFGADGHGVRYEKFVAPPVHADNTPQPQPKYTGAAET